MSLKWGACPEALRFEGCLGAHPVGAVASVVLAGGHHLRVSKLERKQGRDGHMCVSATFSRKSEDPDDTHSVTWASLGVRSFPKPGVSSECPAVVNPNWKPLGAAWKRAIA